MTQGLMVKGSTIRGGGAFQGGFGGWAGGGGGGSAAAAGGGGGGADGLSAMKATRAATLSSRHMRRTNESTAGSQMSHILKLMGDSQSVRCPFLDRPPSRIQNDPVLVVFVLRAWLHEYACDQITCVSERAPAL
jgi:hypothetical protein